MASRFLTILCFGLVAAACVSNPPEEQIAATDFKRVSDSVSVDASPEVLQQFLQDKEACENQSRKKQTNGGGQTMSGNMGWASTPGLPGGRKFHFAKCLFDYGYIRK